MYNQLSITNPGKTNIENPVSSIENQPFTHIPIHHLPITIKPILAKYAKRTQFTGYPNEPNSC